MKKLPLLLLVTIILASCYSHKKSYRSGWGYFSSSREMAPAYGSMGGNEKAENKNPERLVIYNASISLSVKNADTVNANLTRLAAKYEGYALSMGNEQSVIRVKSKLLTDAVKDVVLLGKLKHKTISGDDVTDDYEDSNIRLDNAKKARQRYLELLAKAENVEAALKVERELERLNKEIDTLEGRIKRLEHLSEFSTITVRMEKKVKPGILGYIFVGIYSGVKWLFVRN